MRGETIIASLTAALCALGLASTVSAEETKEAKIARAESAAPAAISDDATIVDVDGTVLREGSNGWICMPGIMPGDDHPMCNDDTWMEFMDAIASKREPDIDRIGISYMLQGDAHVNNADPFDKKQDPGETWVQEGPHLMILVPDPVLLQGVPHDPHNGGPYVMWGDTPYAHIMVPVVEK